MRELAIDGGFGAAAAVYTFNSAGLELQHAARKRGFGADHCFFIE